MKQTIKGKFDMVLRGIPFFLISRTHLRSEKGHRVTVLAIHIGPIALGMHIPRGKE